MVEGAPRQVFRQGLLAGASVLALTLNTVPAMAACTPVTSNTTIGTSTGCVTWSGGNLSVTNTGTISSGTAAEAVNGTGGNGTLTNSGTISGTNSGIITGGTIGTLSNTGSISGGNIGVTNNGTIGALINTGGTIKGSGDGIYNSGGSITTLSNSGIIGVGGNLGILNTATIGTLSNTGTITGSNQAIQNDTSIGTLVNSGSISISGGGAIVVEHSGSIGTLSDSGTINGKTGIANIGSIGTLTLTNTGAIIGSGNPGIANNGSIGALTNGGTITGGISNNAGGAGGGIGTLTNSGTISGGNTGITNTGNGSIGALSNSGAISGGAHYGINNGGTVGTLTNTGTISGGHAGIYNNGATIASLTNSGTISSSGSYGINNTIGSIGALSNSGAISGGVNGLGNSGSIGTLSNTSTGTISGGSGDGIYDVGSITALSNFGTISGSNTGIINVSGASIGALSNSGTIKGGSGATHEGISNAGIISTLTNTGSISGYLGIGNFGSSGTISTLSNTGAIGGGKTGVYNSGSIGTLTNNGTIQGPTAILNTSTGTLGPIVNSGLIAGNIINQASQSLTIDGGSGTIFGTLTGAGGSIGSANQGTITNTAANLVFASGNLLLNDAVNVGGNTIVNSGATLKLVNPVAITGAYRQTGGGLVVQAASGSSYGYLAVSGSASVANAAIVISGAGLASGTSFTIVRAGATGSYTGDTASIVGSNDLNAIVQTIGDDLVVNLEVRTGDPGGFTAIGAAAGGVAAQLGPVLDQINGSTAPGAAAFQNAVLVPLVQLPASQQGEAIKQLAPAQIAPQLALDSALEVQEAVEQHQQAIMAYNPETGEAAGSAARDTTLWGQALGGEARRDSNAAADGYHSTDFGLTAGVDHLFTPQLLGGVAASWLHAWARGLDGAGGQSTDLDSYQLTFYGTYRYGRLFIDGQLGAGWNQFGQNRAIPFLGETAAASYDGQQYLAHALFGYDLPLRGTDMMLTPLLGLRWLSAHDGAYAESGAGPADLSVNGETLNSLTQELGLKTTWSLATGLGRVTPELTAEWVHDYTHGPIATSGVIGGEAFAVSIPRIAADGARLRAGATLDRSDHLSFRLEYDGELRSGYQSHTGLFKLLWKF